MLSIKYKKTQEFLIEILDNRVVEKRHYHREGVKTTLLELYKNCCAYCEQGVEKSAHIDHYRPKDTKLYYWLGAEWSNFILLCADCNHYKSNNFKLGNPNNYVQYNKKNVQELKGKPEKDWEDLLNSMKIDNHNLVDEEPLLPHPFFDNPLDFIKFTENGKIEPTGVNKTKEYEQGKYFVEILKFSVRNSLFERRNEKISDIRKTVTAFGEISDDSDLEIQVDLLLGRIFNHYHEQREFAFLYLYCYLNFKTLFIEIQEETYKKRLQAVFHKIVTNVYGA